MPRKPNLPKEINVGAKKCTVPITYDSFEPYKADYLEVAKEYYNATNFKEKRCNHSLLIERNVIKPLAYFTERRAHNIAVTAEDLDNALKLLIEITEIFNQSTRYQPTIFSFCRLISISSDVFNQWISSNDDRGNKCREIVDYFRLNLTQSMITGEINPKTGEFIGKSTLGMKDNENAPTNINIFGTDMTFEEIMADYERNMKKVVDK